MTSRENQYREVVSAINRLSYGEGPFKEEAYTPPPNGINGLRWNAMVNSVFCGNFEPQHDLRANWKIWRYDYTLPA